VQVVKPFRRVIARDARTPGNCWRYWNRRLQVDSSRSDSEEEAMITRLLAVEGVDEPTEIVIHVHMLKTGWDVTNLYIIVP
jgi:type III restriction enzyme